MIEAPQRLRIALTADPYLPVPPRLYGGIERVVDFLARGLAERGHEVTLFAHPASDTAGELVAYGAPPHSSRRQRLTELWQVGFGLWRRRQQLDLVHSFGRLAALLPVLPFRGLAKIQSYQRDEIPWRSVERATSLAGNSLRFTACAAHLFGNPPAGRWQAVFNGVELASYPFAAEVPPSAPLVFLGRIEAIKGVHHAIAIARGTSRDLVIAGNRVPGEADQYFRREVEPHLDGQRVRYVGPVDDTQKAQLLGTAAALLMPIEWEEPFGIVMAEAMACGTPVIAFARGSVPEVVRAGVNGFACLDVREAMDAVGRLSEIDRTAVRRDCEARFSSTAIIDAYEAIYRDLVAQVRVNAAGPGKS
jgi:glycosyltransferase involved in cell wall biosynthesis